MAWNGVSSAVVTATPMMSNTMPMRTMPMRMTNESAIPALPSSCEDTRLMTAEMTMVSAKISTIH